MSETLYIVDFSQVQDVEKEQYQKDTRMKACYLENCNCHWVVVIVELKNEPMGYLILLIHVGIKANNPNIKDNYGYSSPSREIPRKDSVVLQGKVVNLNDHNQQYQERDADPDPKSQETGVKWSGDRPLCSFPEKLSSLLAFLLQSIFLNIKVLNFIYEYDIDLLYPICFSVVSNRSLD